MLRFKTQDHHSLEDVATAIYNMVYPNSGVSFENDPGKPEKWYIGTKNNVWLYTTNEPNVYELHFRYKPQEYQYHLMWLLNYTLKWKVENK